MRLPKPAQWDTLPLLGVGATGQVRALGRRWVLKVAHPGPEARAALRQEVSLNRALRRLGIPVARVLRTIGDGRALIRQRVDAPVTAAPTVDHFQLWLQVDAAQRRLGVRLDFSPSNVRATDQGVVLVDCGVRGAAPIFRAQKWPAFQREWKAYFRRRPAARVEPTQMPPSGRFHVEVPVGPERGSRLLWVNRGLLGRLGLKWPDSMLAELGNLSTRAAPTTRRVATRYADMIAFDLKRGPRGDGRSVYLGRLLGRELTLKGCGPTPLAWKGVRFHDDGLVSFPRTLWEVTAADELARLGFDVPEYLCVLSTSPRVRDNTLKSWPAAKGVRLAATHFRLGHLRRQRDRPDALAALVRYVDFDPLRFARNLGRDIGRTDALQIHCFNPTPGNVRVDGHLIDFSTVRFFRDYLPDWRFLDNQYRVRVHGLVWKRLCNTVVEVLGDERLRAPLLRAFDRAYQQGFAEELGRFFGFVPPRSVSALVTQSQRLRALRRDAMLDFPYWKQRVPAPRFDFLGRAPQFVRAVRRGQPEAYRALLTVPSEELPAEQQRVAESWLRQVAPLIRRSRRSALAWKQVVRPGMEPERLARLIYGRSTPARFDQWKAFISTSRHLPPGRYGFRAALAWAERLNHIELPCLAGGTRRVIGLPAELHRAAVRALRKVLGRRLVGVVAHGSRVLERRELERIEPFARRLRGWTRKTGIREGGPSPEASSDLDLKVFVRGPTSSALERRVGEALAELGAWFPFSARTPPRQRLIPTRLGDVLEAFRAWNGVERRRTLGKAPIFEAQAVVFDGRRRVSAA